MAVVVAASDRSDSMQCERGAREVAGHAILAVDVEVKQARYSGVYDGFTHGPPCRRTHSHSDLLKLKLQHFTLAPSRCLFFKTRSNH